MVDFNTLSALKARDLSEGKYSDGQGLWLVKRSKAAGKWVLRYSTHGKRKEMGLGGFPAVSLAEARERADTARRHVRDGVDPIVDRQRRQQRAKKMTVAEAIAGCFKARQAQLKGDGQAGRWMSPLSVHVIPRIGTMPIEDVDQHTIKRLLDGYGTKSRTAPARRSIGSI